MSIESFRLHEFHCQVLSDANWTIGLDSYSLSTQIKGFAPHSGKISLLAIYKERGWFTRVFSSVRLTLDKT
jgi:hypothetical protein